MKNNIIYLILVFSTTIFSQRNPKVYGKVNELSVGPDLSIWLTTGTGNVYKTSNIDSTWNTIIETNPGVEYKTASPHMDRVLFFNSDTAIIYGYLTKSFYEEKKNKVYRTTNGGKTWEWVEFGKGDHWIRDGQAFTDGTCWLASNKGIFYYSKDYGITWEKTSKIFTKVKEAYMRKPDIYSFHYIKDEIAIAANKNNQLASSSTNFKEFKRISTPLDNKLFEKEYKSYYEDGSGRKNITNLRIYKVRIFSNHYFVYQNNEMYYTPIDKIEWKKYSLNIVSFEVDNSTNKMFAVTKEGNVIEILEDLSSRDVTQSPIKGQYIDMKIIDNNLIILAGLYKNNIGKDKTREQRGNLTVVEKNYKELTGYNIYKINKIENKSIYLEGK